VSEKPAAVDYAATLTLYSPHKRPLHIPGLGMLIPGANSVGVAAWDAVKDRPTIRELGLRAERMPAQTAGRDEASACALASATLDVKRLEAMKAQETRPAVLAAIGAQTQKLYVPPKPTADTRSPIEQAIALPVVDAPAAPEPVQAPAPVEKSEKHEGRGDDRRRR
jgi:hypothetical protein